MDILEELSGMTEEERKQGRIELMVQSGLSRADALFADELAGHAADKAFQAMETIAKTAPAHLMPPVTIIALRFIQANADTVLELISGGAMPTACCPCSKCTAKRQAEQGSVH